MPTGLLGKAQLLFLFTRNDVAPSGQVMAGQEYLGALSEDTTAWSTDEASLRQE